MGCACAEEIQDLFKENEELLLFLKGSYVSAMLNVVVLLFLLDAGLGCIIFCSDVLVCPYHPIRASFPHPQFQQEVGMGSVGTPGCEAALSCCSHPEGDP